MHATPSFKSDHLACLIRDFFFFNPLAVMNVDCLMAESLMNVGLSVTFGNLGLT